ncbi:MAG: membrane protein insertase YidC [Clostridia bacterium]|nr:membrane protein insertase YidC [Clostridia bacterium]
MIGLYKVLGVPFGFLLKLIYETIGFGNFAVSIVLLTLIARLILIPSTIQQQKGMAKNQRMQSKIRKIQEKYAGDQRRIQEETQALYQREGYNPMSAGCGAPMIIQFLILFGLIGAIYYPLSNFLRGISSQEITTLTSLITSFKPENMAKSTIMDELLVVQHIKEIAAKALEKGVSQATIDKIGAINFSFFGLFNLGDIPKNFKFPHIIWAIPVLSTISTLASSLYSMIKQKDQQQNAAAAKSMGCMTIGMAGLSLWFVVSYPAGIGIYWIASGLFGFIQSVLIGHFYSPKKVLAKLMVEETVQRRSKENNIKFAAKVNEEK